MPHHLPQQRRLHLLHHRPLDQRLPLRHPTCQEVRRLVQMQLQSVLWGLPQLLPVLVQLLAHQRLPAALAHHHLLAQQAVQGQLECPS